MEIYLSRIFTKSPTFLVITRISFTGVLGLEDCKYLCTCTHRDMIKPTYVITVMWTMSLETEVTIAIPLEREKLDQGEKILFLNIFNNKVMIHVQNH